eukprot:TRINITY_DN42232_c0_g1_i3.p2 TRINITY_DN42232_c0_g1~~TRINITY_DN42232_c0_g1_i3.p2  ORF type:complete len:182 (+),score=35.40 TRINITY_DN42232_c0_g1_i3:150-695(+)
MGSGTSMELTQYDYEDVRSYCDNLFSHNEINALYSRFRILDRGSKGYITAEIIKNIPELSVNPLAQRIIRMFDNVNFKDFVLLLSAFSSKASHNHRVRLIFRVYDVDQDGIVSRSDLGIIVRELVGNNLSDEQVKMLINEAIKLGGGQSEEMDEEGLTLEDFERALNDAQLDMDVDVPVTD